MKKWMIIFGVLIGVSAVGSGAVLGKIYRQELKVYEQNLEEPLQKEALKNIFIDSAVPVRLETTDGEPRVEFHSSLRGIIDKEYEYKLDIKNEGDTSYITISEEQIPHINFIVENEQLLATVYLPKQDIKKLSINTGYSYYGYHPGYELQYNISDINVETLQVQSGNADLKLDGNYKNIDVNLGYGKVSINSQTPAEVSLSGGGNLNLKGQYKSIEINNHHGSISVASTTPCRLAIYGDSTIQAEGAFEKIDIKSNYGDVYLSPTIIPERINLFGQYNGVSITLPKNIPGFEITKNTYYGEDSNVYSDFKTTVGKVGEELEKVYYGDNSTKIVIEEVYSTPYILEGAAVSVSGQ